MLKWRNVRGRRSKSLRKAASAGQYEQKYIQERAYLLWEADGSPEGKSEYYWLKAVEEVTGKRSFVSELSYRITRYFKAVVDWAVNLIIKRSRRTKKYS
ncbi:MAG: DUF2934 domain-containing protein [Synechococcus sp.]